MTRIYNLYKRISKHEKSVFMGTFLITFFTHAFILLNHIPNHDGIMFFYHDQDTIYSGRWFLKYAGALSSYFYLHYLNGFLSIVYISCTTVLVVRLLKIKHLCLGILMGALIGTYPSVACTFTYMYTADAYMLSMLLATIAVYCMVSGDWRKGALGSMALGFSMGIYQAYLSFALVLLCLWMLRLALLKIKTTLKTVVSILGYLALGGAVYVAGLLIRLQGRELSSYQGIAESTLLHAPIWYAEKICDSYKKTYLTILRDDIFDNSFIQGCVFVLCIVCLCMIVYRSAGLFMQREWGLMLRLWSGLLLIPIAAFGMSFLSEGVVYHKLMMQSLALIWAIPILLLDSETANKAVHVLAELAAIGIVLNVGSYVIGDNIIYFSNKVSYEKTYALSVRLVARMEEIENYETAEYVYIAGSMNYMDADLAGKTRYMLSRPGGDILTYYNLGYVRMINRYIGGHYEALTSAEKIDALTSSLAYQEMPVWPAQDSVRMIDNVIVAKLSEQ